MEKLFFFVTNSDAWKSTRNFHENFFVNNQGFFYGIVLGLVVAAIMAAIFYFGLCNNKRESASASIPVWGGFLAGTAVIVLLVANFVIIGKPGTTDINSIFYKNSFYKANNEYVIKQTKNTPNQQFVTAYNNDMRTINENLDKGKDVRYAYDLGCAVYSILFFYLISLLIKGFTINGLAIPHLWPHKNV